MFPKLSPQLKESSRLVGFTGGSDGKESACNAGDLDLIPGLGRSPGGDHGNPLQYFCLENPQGQRSLEGYSWWRHKELDANERLRLIGLPRWYVVKNLLASAGDARDLGLIPGLERSLEEDPLGNPMHRGAWRAAVHRVAKSQTWLCRISSSHSRLIQFFPEYLKDGLPLRLSSKESACQSGAAGDRVGKGGEDPLEEDMETDSSILAWRILWTEKRGTLLFIKLQRVGHDWSIFAHMHTPEKQRQRMFSRNVINSLGFRAWAVWRANSILVMAL